MKKFFSYFDVQVGNWSLPQPSVVVTGFPSQITRFLKQHFKKFLNACLNVLNERTNKQTQILMSGTNTLKKQNLALFCSRTHSLRDNNKHFIFSLCSGPTRTLRRFWAGIYCPQILEQLVHTVETKKNDNRVLQRLDSSHDKCSYPGPEECFWRQW